MNDYFLTESNTDEVKQLLTQVIEDGLAFKNRLDVAIETTDKIDSKILIQETPVESTPLEEVISEFKEKFLPYCYNFASPNFMGFPDAGNSIAAITGAVYSDLLQQNLINQSFCSPSATFAEISVIRWLRDVVGYQNSPEVQNIFEVGGMITGGGTTSNTIGIMLARENYQKNCMKDGVHFKDGGYLVVPKGIGHYSVKSAQMWLGCGNRLLEVETNNFKYDLQELKKTLKKYKGQIMALVAYAGDSRSMSVDNFSEIHDLVKQIDSNIWLHADACHGFSLGFSKKHRHKLKGLEKFDSITTDPHKTMNAPYTVSALLIKDPEKVKTISTTSDLIMQEQFAFGQTTPFIGSKQWWSLKLWFAMKHIGMNKFGEIIDDRYELAAKLAILLSKDGNFKVLNDVEINSVVFMYTGSKKLGTEDLNSLNKQIHNQIISDGKYHLHQFSVPGQGSWKKGELLYPLRFMSGNPNTTEAHLKEMLNYIKNIGSSLLVS